MEPSDILYTLFRTTLFLSVSGGICYFALRRIEDRVPRLSRALWLSVLLSGWVWIQSVIAIPWKTVEPPTVETLAVEPLETQSQIEEPQPVAISQTNFNPIFEEPQRFPQEFSHEIAMESPPIVETFAVESLPPPVSSLPPPAIKPTIWKTHIFPIMLAVWFGGMVVTIILAMTGYVRFLLALRKTVPANDEFVEPWYRLLKQLGIDPRTIPMFVSMDDPSVGPALIRTIHGYRLVVPYELWSELSEPGRCGILKHELAHFQRRDVWKSFFVRILVIPHWFNPIAHLAMHRFDEAAEQLCDRAAFDMQQEGVLEFARTLLLLHENAPTQFVARQSIFGRGLKHRVACLLLENHTKKVSLMKKILLITGAIILLTACIFRVELVEKIVAQNTQQKQKTEQKQEDEPEPQASPVPLTAAWYGPNAVPPSPHDTSAEIPQDAYIVVLYLAELEEKPNGSKGLKELGITNGLNSTVFSVSSDSANALKRALEERYNVKVLSRPQMMVIPDTIAMMISGSKDNFYQVNFLLKKQEDSQPHRMEMQIEKHVVKDGKTTVSRSEISANMLENQPLISSGELDGRQFIICAAMVKAEKAEPQINAPNPDVNNYFDSNLMSTNCSIQMKKIQMALNGYHKEKGHFPRPYTTDTTGKPLQSWKVSLLPYLGEKNLYDKIRKDEPWDSEYNKQFHSQCPAVFQCPFALASFPEMKKRGQTTYALIVGKTAYPETEDLVLGKNFRDGTANTVAIVERKTPVDWMNPKGDIPQSEAEKGIDRSENGIGLLHGAGGEYGTPFCFFDGSVHSVRKNLALRSLHGLMTPDGGESVHIFYDDDAVTPPPVPEPPIPFYEDSESPLGFFQTKGKNQFSEKEDEIVDLYKVGVKVLMPDGTPAKNATINYKSGQQGASGFNRTTTDENGYFKMDGWRSPYHPYLVAVATMPGENVGEPGLASPVTLWYDMEKQPEERFELRLQKGVTINGTVTQEGKTMPGVRMSATLKRENPDPKNAPYITNDVQFDTKTDEQGNYRFVIPPGEFQVNFSNTPWDQTTGSASETESEQTVDLKVAPKTRLRVVQSNGQPVPEVKVSLHQVTSETKFFDQKDNREKNGFTYQKISSPASDEQGVIDFYLSPLCSVIRYRTETAGGFLRLEGEKNVGKEHTLTLQPFARGKVRIVSKANGKPITGAQISLEPSYPYEGSEYEFSAFNDEYETKTNENGYAFFPKMIPGDRYRLRIQEYVKLKPDDEYPCSPQVEQRFTCNTPGQETDFGTIQLDGDFSEFAPEEQSELRSQNDNVTINGIATHLGLPMPGIDMVVSFERKTPGSEKMPSPEDVVIKTTKTDWDGSFSSSIPPGEFKLYFMKTPWDGITAKTSEIKKGQPLFMEIAPESKLHVIQSDGKPAVHADSYMIHIIQNRAYFDKADQRERMASTYGISYLSTDQKGDINFYASPFCSIIRSQTETEGGILVLEGEKNIGMEQTLKLQPFAKGKVRLVSKESGKAIVGANVQWKAVYRYKNDKHDLAAHNDSVDIISKTDENGYAYIPKMIVGDSYKIRVGFDDIEEHRFTGNTPCEETDFGTIQLDGDFTAFTLKKSQPQGDVSSLLGLFPTRDQFPNGEIRDCYKVGARILMPNGTPAKKTKVFYQFRDQQGPYAETITDENGYFKTGGLLHRENLYLSAVATLMNENSAESALATPVTLWNNMEKMPKNRFELRLQKGVVIKGQITQEGQPIPTARLLARLKVPPGESKNSFLILNDVNVLSMSDENGNYRFAIPPGEFELQFNNTPWYSLRAKADETKNEQTVNLEVPPKTQVQIFQSDGKPASDAVLSLTLIARNPVHLPPNQRYDVWKNSSYSSIVQADTNGVATFNASPFCSIIRCQTEAEGKILIFEGKENVEKKHSLTLRPLIDGKVRLVSKASGKPIVGVKVWLKPVYRYMSDDYVIDWGTPYETKSDENGYAFFPKMVITEHYRIRLPDNSKEEQKLTSDITETEIDFGTVSFKGDFSEFTLENQKPELNVTNSTTKKASATSGDSETIMPGYYETSTQPKTIKTYDNVKGRIVDDTGKPLSGVQVRIDTSITNNRNQKFQKTDEMKTDADGRFSFKGPFKVFHGLDEEGKSMTWSIGPRITFHKDGYEKVEHGVTPITNEFNVTLQRGVPVRGRVIDDRTGKGASEVEVQFFKPNVLGGLAEIVAKTDTEGFYRTETVLSPDTYLIFVLDQDYQRRSQEEAIGKIEGVEVTLDKPVFEAPDLHINQCGWIVGSFVDSVTKEHVPVSGINIDHVYIDKTQLKGRIFTQQPYTMSFGPAFKVKAFPGENVLRMVGNYNRNQIKGLNNYCTKIINVKPGETVPIQFEVVRDVKSAESLGKLPEPVESERDAVEAIKRLGGWYELDSDKHVVNVNMVFREVDNIRYDNPQTETDAVMPHLPNFSRLKTLLLKNGQATSTSAVHFEKLENLETLYFWDAKITDDGVKHLAGLKKLRSVHIDNAGLTDASMEVLSKLPNIEKLSLQENRFTNRGLEYMQHSKTLKTLWWCLGETKPNDESLAILGKFPALEETTIQNGNLTITGIETLSAAPRLRKIRFYSCNGFQNMDTSRLTNALLKIKTLENFSEGNDQLGFSEEQAAQLAKALPNLKELGRWNEKQLQRLRNTKLTSEKPKSVNVEIEQTPLSDADAKIFASRTEKKKTYENIVGRVVDEQGKPLKGVLVRYDSKIETETDADGRFTFDGPFTISYTVYQDEKIVSWQSLRVTFFMPGREKVEQGLSPETNEFNVTLQRGVPVCGRVIDDQTGKGAPEVEVCFFCPNKLESWVKIVAKTDAEGYYQTETALTPNSYMIFVLNQDYQMKNEEQTIGKIEGVEVVLDKPVFEAPDLHINQCGWIEGTFIDSVTKKRVVVPSVNIDHVYIGKARFQGRIFTQQPFLMSSGTTFKVKAFPGENVLRLLGGRVNNQIMGLDAHCTKPINVKPGETVSVQFEVMGEVKSAESLGKLPEPIEQEREAAEVVKRLGGWYRLDSDNHVTEVNMASRYVGDVNYRNPQTETDAVMLLLPKFSRLKSLNITAGQATNETAVHFEKLENLETLFFTNAKIGDNGVKHLAGLKKLRYVKMDNAGLTDASMEVFSKLPNIEKLSLQGNRFTNRGLEYLQQSKTLKELWWCLGETKPNDESLAILAKFPALEDVVIQKGGFTAAGFEALSVAPRLRKIWVSSNDGFQNMDFSRLTEALSKMKTLENFNGENNIFFSEEQAVKLAKALPNLKELGRWNEEQLRRLREARLTSENSKAVQSTQLPVKTYENIVGRVVDDRGEPVEGVLVQISSVSSQDRNPSEKNATKTDGDGRFTLPGPFPVFEERDTNPSQKNGYGVTFSIFGRKTRTLFPSLQSNELYVTMERCTQIRGRVIDARTGQGAANAEVHFYNMNDYDWDRTGATKTVTKTDSQGNYRTDFFLPQDRYAIFAFKGQNAQDEFIGKIEDVKVNVDESIFQAPDVRIDRCGWIKGIFVDTITKELVELGHVNVKNIFVAEMPTRGLFNLKREFSYSSDVANEFKIMAFPGENALCLSTHTQGKDYHIKDLDFHGYTESIRVKPGETVLIAFEVQKIKRSQSLGELPEPVEQERDAAKAVKRLGGWYTLDSDKHVVEVNMVKRFLNGRQYDNGQTETDAVMSQLPSFSRLKSLEICLGQATNESAAYFAKLENLEKLSFENAKIGDEGLAHLSGLKKLKFVSIGDDELTDTSLKMFSKMSNIRQLYLANNRFTNRGLEYLQDSQTLEEIFLYNTLPESNDERLAILAKIPALKEITIRYANGVTAGGFEALSQAPHLRKIVLVFNDKHDLNLDIPRVCEALSKIKTLEGVTSFNLRISSAIDSLPFSEEQAAKLAKTLPNLKELGRWKEEQLRNFREAR